MPESGMSLFVVESLPISGPGHPLYTKDRMRGEWESYGWDLSFFRYLKLAACFVRVECLWPPRSWHQERRSGRNLSSQYGRWAAFLLSKLSLCVETSCSWIATTFSNPKNGFVKQASKQFLPITCEGINMRCSYVDVLLTL